MNQQKTSWGKVAKWYDTLLEKDLDSYQEKVIKPNLLRIVEPKTGQKILDLGCGQGFFSKLFAKAGANVVGVDIAKELVEIAKKDALSNEKYFVASADKLTPLLNNSFDLCVCILAIQNIKNFQNVISEVARVLKPNGKCVLVLNHPVFRIPGKSFWDYDERTNVQFRKITGYMSELEKPMEMNPGQKDPRKKIVTWSFHRPLQSYFKAFAKANLVTTKLEEWISHKTSDKGTRKQAEDKARKEIPMFLCLELKKC